MPDWAAWPFPTEDPYPAYHAARVQAPVQWDEQLGAHLVLSHDHAAAILRSPEWSSDPRNSPQMLASLGGPGSGSEMWSESLLMSDPPTHTRLRSSVNRFFTPRAVQGIRERVAAIVDSAVTPVAEGEPIELMSELAYPIPLAVISELFDVGLEGAELLRSETPTLARMLELDPTPAELEAIGAAAMTVMLFLVPIVAQRRSDPGEDLLSALIHPPEGGVALETDEIITMCLLLLAAGHETTANLIGNGTLALFEHPDQLDWLVRHPDLSMQAVDELLRYDSPVQVASRVALSELTLGESRVLKGQQALIVLGAANRDPSLFADPDRLDLTRTGPRHLAFGNGPHFCVGAGLARLEAQETFRRLAQSALRPSAGSWSYSRDRSRTFRRLRSLHIGGSKPPHPEQTLNAVTVP
ncbi:MAG TPA: cytochrome P450 [Solirubrobacteraceae bacterium]